MEEPVGKEIRGRRYPSPIKLLSLTECVAHRTIEDLVNVAAVNNPQSSRTSRLLFAAKRRLSLGCIVRD